MFLMNLKIKPGVDVTRPKGSHMISKTTSQNDADNIEKNEDSNLQKR